LKGTGSGIAGTSSDLTLIYLKMLGVTANYPYSNVTAHRPGNRAQLR
jgi:hypothetical protein